MTQYTDEFSWLASMFRRDKIGHVPGSIRDQTPGSFEAYGRILPPIEINLSKTTHYRWSELACLSATELSPETSWADLFHAIVSTNDGPLQHVGAGNIVSRAWDMPRRWRSAIGSILSRHDVSDKITFGVWDGYEAPYSAFPCHRYLALDIREYHTWSGTYEDFGLFHAQTTYGRIFPQDIAWPSSRSWFYCIDTDWASGLIAGTHAMIASLVAACEIEVVEIDGCLPSRILAEISPTTPPG